VKKSTYVPGIFILVAAISCKGNVAIGQPNEIFVDDIKFAVNELDSINITQRTAYILDDFSNRIKLGPSNTEYAIHSNGNVDSGLAYRRELAIRTQLYVRGIKLTRFHLCDPALEPPAHGDEYTIQITSPGCTEKAEAVRSTELVNTNTVSDAQNIPPPPPPMVSTGPIRQQVPGVQVGDDIYMRYPSPYTLLDIISRITQKNGFGPTTKFSFNTGLDGRRGSYSTDDPGHMGYPINEGIYSARVALDDHSEILIEDKGRVTHLFADGSHYMITIDTYAGVGTGQWYDEQHKRIDLDDKLLSTEINIITTLAFLRSEEAVAVAEREELKARADRDAAEAQQKAEKDRQRALADASEAAERAQFDREYDQRIARERRTLNRVKSVGDFVCDGDDGMELGYIERVSGKKVQSRSHVHESGSSSFGVIVGPIYLPPTVRAARDYDTFTWRPYNTVMICPADQ
jgi:hypothetical protein